MAKLRYNRTFKQGITAILFLALLCGFMIVYSIIAKIQYNDLVADMISVEATIVDIDLDVHVRGLDEQEIYITYEVDGVTYSRELKTDTKISFAAGSGAHYSVGDKIGIFYDPLNPDVIASPRSVTVGNFWFVFGAFLLALVFICLIYVIRHRRKFLVTQEEYDKESKQQKKSKATEKSKKKQLELKEIDGEKIRWQYFNTYIYIMLSFIPAIPLMAIMMDLRKGSFDGWNAIAEILGALPVVVAMYAFFLGPFIILSIFNRFCFGTILGVVSEDTVFLKNHTIPIKDITKIVYNPRIMSRRRLSFSFATFYVKSKDDSTVSFDVVHFPIYGLRTIKKHNAEIKLECDKYIWFLILCPTVIFAVLGFLI